MLQQEYLQAYKGFFVEDPHFDLSYSLLMKPETLRTMLTERIERGSPGPDKRPLTPATPPLTPYDTIEPGELVDDDRRRELRKLKYSQKAAEIAATSHRPSYQTQSSSMQSQSLPAPIPREERPPVSVSAQSMSAAPLPLPPPVDTPMTKASFHSFNKLKALIREKLKIQTAGDSTSESEPASPAMNTTIDVPDLVKQALSNINNQNEVTEDPVEEMEYPTSSTSSGDLVSTCIPL